MHWSTALYKAAEAYDGGPRSFPLASEADFARKHGYEPPNEDYEKLFLRRTAASRSQRDPDAGAHSAGWLIPHLNDNSLCKPVFVAHSVLSAVWLLRETLADDALSNDGWERLVYAAQSLAEDGMLERPSAQKASTLPLMHRKRPASPIQASPAKRARKEGGTPLPASPQPPGSAGELDAPPAEQLVEEQRTVTTITNRNRVAELKRERDAKAAQAKRNLSLGLFVPDKNASNAEHGAYASMSPKDGELISWLFEQSAVNKDRKKTQFFNAVKTPYLRARDFINKARALGSPSSQEHAVRLIWDWRDLGSLFGENVPGTFMNLTMPSRLPRTQSSQRSSVDDVFCHAWDRCRVLDDATKFLNIKYRWAHALMGKARADKLAQLERSDKLLSNNKTSRFGKGQRRTEAIDSLMSLVNLNPNPSRQERYAFQDRMGKAVKWYRIAEGLGWGVLLVMPVDVISNTWIENTIRSWGVEVFIELVKKERPDVCLAARQFERWLGPQGMAGGDIRGNQPLNIEFKLPEIERLVRRLDGIADSEDEATDDNEDDSEDDGRVEIAPSQSRSRSAPPASLRQTTLPELFKTIT
jgi:hypothetical protein